MLLAAHNPEPIQHALARRCLTQELPMQIFSESAAKTEVAKLAPHMASLASGFGVTLEAAGQALREQQEDLAADVLALFPEDGAMEHVSAQIMAKASPGDSRIERGRERE